MSIKELALNMKTKYEILHDFKVQVLKGIIGIKGYGISFDENREPYIFVDVKSRDYNRLSAIFPKDFQDIPVKIRIVEKSNFLLHLGAS